MCGIAGFYSQNNFFTKEDLIQMTSALAHRGPDAEGYFQDDTVSLGHKRLSIIDLSEAANQPMHSHCNRYVIVYNGEVYNYLEIAKKLNRQWKTHSDTEVILEAFAEWGTDFVHKLNGMFALAIYDKSENILYLFRDRIGIKPLYYHLEGANIAFASETKALLKLNFDKSINMTALQDYFFLEYVPHNQSVFQQIKKLENGHFLKISKNGISKHKYYDIIEKINLDKALINNNNFEELNEKLSQSVSLRKISDVPLGTFLSGGVDSSLISAKLQEHSDIPINTFTIGFDIKSFDESDYANKVANTLKTKHHLSTVIESESKALVENLVNYYDEPFAAESTIPSLLICKKAREKVTVALSGDGGDELFMGYGYYKWHDRINILNKFGGYASRKLISILLSFLDNQKQRAARIFDYKHFGKIWLHIWSQEQYMFSEKEISQLFNAPYKHNSLLKDWEEINQLHLHPYEKISLFDIKNYLANNLLYKMDIASMASGLEVRVPYLDHHLVEFAINLPLKAKIDQNIQKILLKRSLEKYLPGELIYRKKWGFPAPIKHWLQGDLSYLIKKYLDHRVLKSQGIFNEKFIAELVKQFKNGKDYHYKRIWSLIVFQMWYRKYIDKSLC